MLLPLLLLPRRQQCCTEWSIEAVEQWRGRERDGKRGAGLAFVGV